MKKFYPICLVLLASIISSPKAEAQVFVATEFLTKDSHTIEMQVVDSLSNEPVTFASVYLMPTKDTIITNFTLTDTLGNAVLTEVVRGEYNLHVEFMGYRPYMKSMYIRGDIKLPLISLHPDRERLEAAKVSAVGEAVEIRQDTVIYNASSFRTMAGDKLADLLKKMPGIEVSDNGDVTVNGKPVSKITVNGRTFFMGDNKAALDNIPAHLVNKVVVTDKDSDEAEFTGIKTGGKETRMDVEFKDEYKKGFFGDMHLAGGATIKGKEDNEFVADRPFLYEASAMLSAYGEKNQVTTIANAQNSLPDAMGYSSGEGDLSLNYNGVRSNRSIGSNLNTSGIKGMDTNVSVLVNHEAAESKSLRDRTTFMENGDDFVDVSESERAGAIDYVNVNVEMRNKDMSKYNLYFTPRFSYKYLTDSQAGNSVSSIGDSERNHSETFSSSALRQYETGGNLTLGARDLGKSKRVLNLSLNYRFNNVSGVEKEVSTVWFADNGNPSVRDIRYDRNNTIYRVNPSLVYVEPLGQYWMLATTLRGTFSAKNNYADAFNADGTANDYYTSVIRNRYTLLSGDWLAQYIKNNFTLYMGVTTYFIKNLNFARSFGVDTETGKDEWQNKVSPYLTVRWKQKNMNYSVQLLTDGSVPSVSSMIPALNVSNPTKQSLGNIYLKPSFRDYLDLQANGNFNNVRLFLSGSASINRNAQVTATWYDANSIGYSIPVQALKPQYSISVSGNLSLPLNKENTISISYNPNFSMGRSTSYQAAGILEGIDVSKFEYSDFMASFWGDASGDRFYSGESGFRESLTNHLGISNSITLRLNFERFNLNSSVRSVNSRSTYSLDPRANTNRWNHRFSINPVYLAPYDISLSLDMSYEMLRGYGAGYDRDYLDMDMKIQKSFKQFTFGLVGYDLFNDVSDSHGHVITENYMENSYSMVMGRRVLFQFVWNFGKMSAAKGMVARTASLNMIL